MKKYIIIFFVLCCCVGCGVLFGRIISSKDNKNVAGNIVQLPKNRYENLEAFKKDMFDSFSLVAGTTEWQHLTFKNVNYHICLEHYPSLGQSHENVYILRQSENNEYVLVWLLKTVGIGTIAAMMDDQKGVVSIKSTSNGELSGTVISFVNLSSNKED